MASTDCEGCGVLSLPDTMQLVSWMRGHEGAVSHLSVHGSGRYAITTSADAAQLWDLDTFQRKRKLNVRQSVAMQRVSSFTEGWPEDTRQSLE